MATKTVTLSNHTYTIDTSTNTMSAKYAYTSTDSDGIISGLFAEIWDIDEDAVYTLTSMKDCYSSVTGLQYPPAIPATVTELWNAFKNCSSLLYPPKIPAGVIDLDACFYGCTSLNPSSRMYIPDTVRYMGSTFYNCSSLSICPSIPYYYDSTNSKYCAPTMDNCFYGCTSLTDARAAFVGPSTSGYYPSNVFSGCTNLQYGPTLPSGAPSNIYTNCSSLIFPPQSSSTTSGTKVNVKTLLTNIMNKLGGGTIYTVNSIYGSLGSGINSNLVSMRIQSNSWEWGMSRSNNSWSRGLYSFYSKKNTANAYSDSSNSDIGLYQEISASGFVFNFFTNSMHKSSSSTFTQGSSIACNYSDAIHHSKTRGYDTNVSWYWYCPWNTSQYMSVYANGVLRMSRVSTTPTLDYLAHGNMSISSGYLSLNYRNYRLNSTSSSTFNCPIYATFLSALDSKDMTYA